MDHKLTVVGIGPGGPEYIVPAALAAIKQARVLVGSARALATYARPGIITKVIDRDLAGVSAFIRSHLQDYDVVVMVSGDPGFYSLLPVLKRQFPAQQLVVIPGLSSVQLAFARLGDVWQDADLVSLHGRSVHPGELAYKPGRKLVFLTDPVNTPRHIAGLLRQQGWPNVPVALCQRLSYPDEEIRRTDLAAACELAGFIHAVMVVMA